MIAIPAIDLREGACVQLVGGSYADERVRIADPIAVAERWRDDGFRRLHVVDLDAATGVGSNRNVIDQLLEIDSLEFQVGGGVRSDADIASLLDAGSSSVIVGTRAVEDPEWIASTAALYPGSVIVASDVRGGRPAIRGWAADSSESLDDLLARLSPLPLAGILVTAVDVEGRMQGPDIGLMERVLALTSLPLIASGGITTMQDMKALRELGVSAAVLGMSLYQGALDAPLVAREFST